MNKILLTILTMSFLGSSMALDMHTINCKSVHLNAGTTLKDVEDICLLKSKRETRYGLYEVDFTNDFNDKTVTCYFGRNKLSSKLNSCKD